MNANHWSKATWQSWVELKHPPAASGSNEQTQFLPRKETIIDLQPIKSCMGSPLSTGHWVEVQAVKSPSCYLIFMRAHTIPAKYRASANFCSGACFPQPRARTSAHLIALPETPAARRLAISRDECFRPQIIAKPLVLQATCYMTELTKVSAQPAMERMVYRD